MSSAAITSLNEHLHSIRALDQALLTSRCQECFGGQFPTAFLEDLDPDLQEVAMKASLMVWTITAKTQIPRDYQLRAFLAAYTGKDCLLNAGTGTGKTMAIVLSLVYNRSEYHSITLTILPLKRLQQTQESDFNQKYCIRTVSINENTPRDDDYWNENVFHRRENKPGTAQHIVTTVEQMFRTAEGHLPRLGDLLRNNRHFRQRIVRVNVDEAHTIYTAGLPHNGRGPFRPGWGRLDEIKALLPSSVVWLAMSATFPPHMLKTVEKTVLRPNYISITLGSNRPNTVYAKHCVLTRLDDPQNFECFLKLDSHAETPFDPSTQPRVLIFFDNSTLAVNTAQHLDSLLGPEFSKKGIIRHYHSGMSDNYLLAAHNAFSEPDGACKILCSTSGESVGVDFADVSIVCNAGLPSDTVDTLQRAGRVSRRPGTTGLFVTFFESWALEVGLNEFAWGDPENPDRTRAPLKDKSNARDRITYSNVMMLKAECLRSFFALYLNDESSNATTFITDHCCDQHGFNLAENLPGQLYTTGRTAISKRKHGGGNYRRNNERKPLDQLLMDWLKKTIQDSESSDMILTEDYILTRNQRAILIRASRHSLREVKDLLALLDETEEWGGLWGSAILSIIQTFDYEQGSNNKRVRTK